MRKQLHVISDGRLSLKGFADIARMVEPFADKFHLREKYRSSREISEGVELLIDAGIPLHKIVINDRVDVAWAWKTGVQLALHSLPANVVKEHFPFLPLGCSVHSLEEAQAAANQGADYLLFGHVFDTQSKQGIPPKGTQALKDVKEGIDIPVLGIGGIKPESVHEVIKAGADGIAVMSGILQAEDPREAAKIFFGKLNKEA